MMSFHQDKLHGIIVYEIKEDGCLNGLYTNNSSNGEIFNQIAKKQKEEKSGDISGTYTTTWIEGDREIRNGTLLIGAPRNGIFDFRETGSNAQGDTIVFVGNGFILDGLFVATYWE